MDAPRIARIERALIPVLALAFLFGCSQPCALAQAEQHATEVELKLLAEQKRWKEIVRSTEGASSRSADVEYLYGTALATLERLDEAHAAFLRGRKMQPHDARFPVELAGVEFKRKRYGEATSWLLKAEKLNPADEYVQDFLGTLYFLQGRLEAALKHWNRVGKPLLETVRVEPQLRVDAVVLDRAIAFSPGAVMQRYDLLAAEARLRGMGIISLSKIELVARDDGKFDAVVHVQERNGFGANKWEAVLSTFRGAPFQTITPEYYNVRGTATNFNSLWRWDSEKRRIVAGVSGPLRRSPKLRYQFGVDLRNENWNVRNFSSLPGERIGALNLRRTGGYVGMTAFTGARWTWSAGVEASYRDFRSVMPVIGFADDLLINGYELKQTTRLKVNLLRIPERKYESYASVSTDIGRVFGGSNPIFAKFQAALGQRWSGGSENEWAMRHEVGLGRTGGAVPFDELFMLGVERDNSLMLRGHSGTADGQKGNAPLGRNYFLSNWELDRRVWSNGLVGVRIGPFLDVGRVTDPVQSFGSEKWLWDTGGQAKLSVLGLQVGLSYGRDLRGGRGAWFASVGK